MNHITLYIVERFINYSNDEFKTILDKTESGIHILNLNCGGLPSNCNSLKLSLSSCNATLIPISIITIQRVTLLIILINYILL